MSPDEISVPSPGGWAKMLYAKIAAVLVIGGLGGAGLVHVYGPISQTSVPGTSTGSTVITDGVVTSQKIPVRCTATGGLTGIYSSCDGTYPYSVSGSLLSVILEGSDRSMVMSLTGDVSIKRSPIAATGTVLTNLNNITVGTGTSIGSVFAVPVNLRKGDHITFSTRTAPTGALTSGPTGRYDYVMWIEIRQKYPGVVFLNP